MATFVVTFDSGEKSLDVRKFIANEAINSPFEVQVFARSVNENVDLERLVGKPAGLLVHEEPMAEPRAWTGVVAHAEQLEAEPTGLSTYFLVLAPTFWVLKKRTNNRIFEHLTIPQIVTSVLAEHKIKAKWLLARKHEEQEYKVQFGETDFAFVNRLLEEAGISYSFHSVPEGDGFKTELVMNDEPQKAELRAGCPLIYNESPTELARREFVSQLRVHQRVRLGRVTVRDFDFARPDHHLDGKSDVSAAPEDRYEDYRYDPASFVLERKGSRRVPPEPEVKEVANVALYAKRNDRRVIRFESNCYDLCPGKVVSFEGHPRKDLSPENQVLITEVSLEGTTDTEWQMNVVGSFTKLPWRPSQRTPKPVMRGVQSAIVVGPKGHEIHTDSFGRVRVQFHWDRDGEYNEFSSCWIRVSQGWSGSAYGMVTLPRIGHEVIVDFMDGDPDHPIVVGRLYNKRTKAPYKLPEHRTKSTWKSNSSPNSDGFNEIMFEDKAGKELIYIQGQNDLSKLVKSMEMERTGANRSQTVGANRTLVVGAVESSLVGKQFSVTMVKPKDLQIEKQGDAEVEVQPTTQQMVDGKISLSTGEMTSAIEKKDISLFGSGDVILKSGGTINITGSHVYINCQDYSGKGPAKADTAGAKAGPPEGRVLDAIKSLFGFKKREKPAEPDRKELVVPHREQVGGTCGLAALGMVMDYWKGKDGSQQAPSPDVILKTAQDKGWTTTGGMWERDEAKLAREFGYDAKHISGGSMADIKKAIDEGKPVLITFSVDNVGEPKNGTDRGHYAVIKGYFNKDGKDYVIAQHGWGSAKHKIWEESAFEQSWKSYNNKQMVIVTPKGTP
ncbi:MAG: type VI secretion system tip protein VgrG [Polyangiaceae bacterium]|nr:type VI secretion system tip protein VgrG [Polyangiaceae bacterium]